MDSNNNPNSQSQSQPYFSLLNFPYDRFSPNANISFSQIPSFSSQPSSPPVGAASQPEKSPRERRNWTSSDDLVLISGWLYTSKDVINGNDQRAEAFWKRIGEYYASSTHVLNGAEPRLPDHCRQRWQNIHRDVARFCGAAGTLGYLDPEYYRLHYLTTKSDVYSVGVLLLEILSGRKAIDMHYEEGNIVEWAVPLIKAGDINAILDPVLKHPSEIEALKRIVSVACKCVRMRGKDRPSMEKVTTALERALAQLMGNPSSEQPILPTEVVLGSSRMHKKSWRIGSKRSGSENTEFRGGSWITFPSVTSSQRRKSSASEGDVAEEEDEGRKQQEALRSLEEEIGPASPGQSLFLHHNF